MFQELTNRFKQLTNLHDMSVIQDHEDFDWVDYYRSIRIEYASQSAFGLHKAPATF